ncbi:MAG: acyl-CoA dehydrogenase [Betaproteobacteria bacterium]|nr:acyl-CoA dehydrogenase [Betaproteobacteria bacterium]
MTIGIDLAAYEAWVGRTEKAEDLVTPHAVRGMHAILDHEVAVAEGDELPPAWHWMFTQPAVRQSQLGPDGHPKRGGFLPPIELPRRMWAGSDVEFHAPLRVGDRIERVSRIESVTAKSGTTGALVFLVVRHEISSSSGGRTVDLQRIVFREAQAGANVAPAKAEAPPGGSEFSFPMQPDPVMLFRFSALTFNGHRIHYDLPYATKAEGYAGLVVHGPLIALAMLDCLQRHRPGTSVRKFAFTPRRPITTPMAMTAHGRREGDAYALWMEAGGSACSVGSATLG